MEKKRVLLKISFFLIIVTFLSLTIGCGKIDKEGPVLASIGNSKITAGSVNKRISNFSSPGDNLFILFPPSYENNKYSIC